MDELIKSIPNMFMEVKQYVQDELSDLKSDFAEIKGDVKLLTNSIKMG